MNENKFTKPTVKKTKIQSCLSNNKKILSNSNSKLNISYTNQLSKNISSVKNVNFRSKSNLTSKDNHKIGKNSNITLERNGSMPNLNTTGNRVQVDKITKLRFAYDKYLSSVEAKYNFQMIEKEITSNINEQKKVFMHEFVILKNQLVTLNEELKSINELKIKKKNLDTQLEALEMLNKTVMMNGFDEEIMSLFTSTTSKVIVTNFKKMDQNEISSVKSLLHEIIESLELIDYEKKINARIELKDLLIKLNMLTIELDKNKLTCEELFEKQESLQSYNLSLKILKAQFGDNPDTTLLPQTSDLMEDIQFIFD